MYYYFMFLLLALYAVGFILSCFIFAAVVILIFKIIDYFRSRD